MWNACNKYTRLRKAMQLRGLDPDNFSLCQLDRVLRKRGITDRVLNGLVWSLLGYLEPPGCPMSHCRHYGHSGAPCNCAAGKVPGRCKILRDYKKRQAEKATKEAS